MHYKKNPASVAIVIVLVLIVLGVLAYLLARKPAATVTPSPADTADTGQAQTYSGDVADLVSVSVAPGTEFSYGTKITLTGSIKGGYFFEGTAHGMLIDAYGQVGSQFPLTATGEWMTDGPVAFSAQVSFPVGVGSDRYLLRLENDNPSGDTTHDKHIDIPIYLNFNG